ncbi:neurotrypsin-like isoform X2 [Liolophura sinensis]|uniref:neurotrypsin-like isoform X2 n=1 Tax=Liolophura sinensis TaxID=3198878 RepID=UPI0031582614
MVFQVFFVILLSGFLGEAESQSGIEIVRLTGGKKPSEGTVEIYFEKEWRPVSYDGFSNMSARILCYALGYNSSRVLYSLNSFYKNTTKRTVMFECWWTLKVTDMKYCVKTDGGEYNRRVAGVDCDPEEFHDVDIRLTHGEYPIVGQLEVKVKGQWGGVCDPGTKDRTAKVACRQLGHSGAMALAIKPWPYNSSVEYLMGSPECDGTETNLGTCKARPWGDTDCKGNRPYYGLGVACLTDNDIHESFQVKIGDYRVYGSETKHPDAGLLLVKVAGVWGTVCKYSLDLKTVTFFCRQASYQWGKVINKVGCYNEIFQHIWFKRITCSGDESYVTECREIEWTPHSCYENKVAVVQCYNDSLPSKPFIEILTPGPMIEGKPMKLRCTSQGERPIYLRWYCDPYYGLGDQSGNDTHISTVITLHRLTMYYNYNRYCSCTVNNDDGWSDSSGLTYKLDHIIDTNTIQPLRPPATSKWVKWLMSRVRLVNPDRDQRFSGILTTSS